MRLPAAKATSHLSVNPENPVTPVKIQSHTYQVTLVRVH